MTDLSTPESLSTNETREPAGGAGLFDVDPDQRGVSQDPAVAVSSDIEALAENMEL
jgi:hypothetical protein